MKFSLDDIKDAMSKLRKVSINQETPELLNNSVSETINELNNHKVVEENFVVSTNTNSNELVNQVFVYEKSDDIKNEDIVSSIKEIDDVLEAMDSMPVTTAATEINNENHDDKILTTQPKGTIAAITATLVENLHLPATELQEKTRKKNLKVNQPQPEVSTPEFFKIKLKHIETKFD
jgi:hypothetical protein